MSINITRISSEITKATNKSADTSKEGSSFGQVLMNQLDRLSASQVQADQLVEAFATGDTVDLHEVLIAAEEARITLEMTLQLRNKAIDAYKEITNMQL